MPLPGTSFSGNHYTDHRSKDMTHILMSTSQFFPIPEDIRALAYEALRRNGAGLPFDHEDVQVTGDLVTAALECLNAEFSKTLPVLAPAVPVDTISAGLDRCLGERLQADGRTLALVIADLLCRAGIAENSEVLDRSSHQKVRGVRLLQPWTWHIASVPLKTVRTVTDSGEESVSVSWTNLCPVCRAGSLNRVSGKQLFGLPHIEYYLECSTCGAKFIPAGGEFRLVSIARIRDPLWKANLEKSFSQEIWAAIANNSRGEKSRVQKEPVDKKPAEKKFSGISRPVVRTETKKMIKAGGYTTLKDGSIALQCGERTLYFKPIKLVTGGLVKSGAFSSVQELLKDVLETPPYQHLKDEVTTQYARYLHGRIGLFLWERKERHDPFYRVFLNAYGDEKFGTVRMKESDESDRAGVFLVISGSEIIHSGCSHESFSKTISEVFGRVSSRDCLLDGDEIRCRINALLSVKKPDTAIYVHVIPTEAERVQVAETLGIL
jgi:hypothetical protein